MDFITFLQYFTSWSPENVNKQNPTRKLTEAVNVNAHILLKQLPEGAIAKNKFIIVFTKKEPLFQALIQRLHIYQGFSVN